MDPDETLRRMRAARVRYVNATDDDMAFNAATDLAAASADLDNWLSAGGFLPADWWRAHDN
jgi:hypothetical protein